MTNRKLTKAQADVLERMATGEVIEYGKHGDRLLGNIVVATGTLKALLNRGLIAKDGSYYNAPYTITEDGRAAVAQAGETTGDER